MEKVVQIPGGNNLEEIRVLTRLVPLTTFQDLRAQGHFSARFEGNYSMYCGPSLTTKFISLLLRTGCTAHGSTVAYHSSLRSHSCTAGANLFLSHLFLAAQYPQ
jgi:hypothetical protein